MKRDIEDVIRLIRGGQLSASEEIAALSALRHNLLQSDADNAFGVVYATPFWSAEPLLATRSSAAPQLAVVADLSSCGAALAPLADVLVGGRGIETRINLRENDPYFAELTSVDEPEEKLFASEAFKAMSCHSFESALLVIGDDLSPDCPEAQDSGGSDHAGRAFLGKLLYTFGIVKALLRRNPSADIRCVTLSDHRRVLSVGAALSGLLKTLVLEHSRFSGRTIWAGDFAAANRSMDAFLRDEMHSMAPGSHREVRLRDGSRFVRKFQEIAIAGDTKHSTVQSGDLVLLTGGLGGVGRILAEYLVKERGACLALAGRTARSMLNDEQATFLRSYASSVEYIQADIAVPDQVRSLVEAAERRFGRIDGVIHAAGVASDGWLSGKNLSSVREVLRPKVLGAWHLGRLVGADLKFFVHFSSLVSYRGNVGQSGYACGNAFLDHHVAVRSERMDGLSRCADVAINWPLWQSGGMRPSKIVTEQMERAFGLGALSSRQGALCFEAILASGYRQVLVAAGDPARLRTSFLAEPPPPEIPLGDLRNNEDADTLAAIGRNLQSVASEALGLAIDHIDPAESLAEYGFDSISLTGFAAGINKLYSFVQLDPAVFLEHSSLNELSRYLHRKHTSAFTGLTAASPTDRARSAILERLTVLVAETTAVPPGDIAPDANLGDYGFDSISLTELAAGVSRTWEWIHLDATVFLLQPTLRDLCEHLLTKYRLEFNAALAPPVTEDRVASETPLLEDRSPASGDIAIIGLGGRFPGARDAIELWNNLTADISCISEIPRDRWDWRDYSGDRAEENQRTDCHYGAFIDGIARFDPLHFDISPREAEVMDPQQRLLLQGAWETLETAGYSRSALAHRRVGVFVGVEKHDYLSVIGQSCAPLDGYVNTGNSHSMLVNRVSYFFDWTGPSVALDTACSSSFSAISTAIRSLRSGESELALAGGVNVLLAPGVFVINRRMRMLTADDHVRPFDRDASGHLYGEGLGLVLLKPLSAAIEDRDSIYGVIKGMSVRHGGRGVFLTAPHARAHMEVIEEALRDAHVAPEEIDYVEAQGSSDPLADRIELKAYHSVFGSRKSAPVKIATIKGHTGHMGAASGVTGIIKAILSLRNHRIVGIRNLRNLNWDASDEKFGCAVVDKTTGWEPKLRQGARVPRTVGIHNFGYGGVNGHVILEEFLVPAEEVDDAPDSAPEIVLLSARTREQLGEMARRLSRYLSHREHRTFGLPTLRLPDIAYTLAVGREALDIRAAFVVREIEQLIERLDRLGRGDEHIVDCCKGKVESLADRWVNGASVDWQQFFGPEARRRVPLPTYPFSNETYWVSPRDPTRPGSGQILHPLLHADTSTDSQQSFRSVFSGQESFLGDHLIQGKRVLPGVACLEMARAAVDRWASQGPEGGLEIELRNVVWMRPIVVGHSPQTVDIRLYPSGTTHARFEISTPPEMPEQEAPTHCQGVAILLAPGDARSVNLAELRLRTSLRSVSADRIYAAYRSGGVAYGPFFRCLQTINIGADQVLAQLVQPSSPGRAGESAAAEPYFLHPGMMDSALQAITGLLTDGGLSESHAPAGQGFFVPFALERLTVLGPTQQSMWAWIRLSENNRATDGLRKVDIELCADTGEVLVSWQGVSNRPLASAAAATTRHNDAEEGALHPAAHEASGLVPTLFLSHFSGNEYYLADHHGILLGAAYLELARAAGERGGYTVAGLRNVVWTRPILVGQAGKKVWTRLQRERDNVGFRISTAGNADGENELIHAQGRFVTTSSELMTRPGPLNIAAILARCSASADTSECARALRLTHGPRVLSVVRLHYGEGEAIAELKLPSHAPGSHIACRLHPSMLNGALLAGVLPGLIRGSVESLPAPFALQELWIFGETPQHAFACVRPATGPSSYDIDITDLTGQVAFSLRGFSMVLPAARHETSVVPRMESLDGAILQRLVAIVSQRQKLRIEDLDVNRQLTSYGFDSVGFTELGNQLNEEMGLDLMPTVFFEYPDLKSLAAYLAETHAAALLAIPDFRLTTAVTEMVPHMVAHMVPRIQQQHRPDAAWRDREPIAVIGMNGRFPGSPDVNEFWRNLEANRDLITEVPNDRWDWRSIYGNPSLESGRTKTKSGGFIEGVDLFDPLFFAISPLEAEAMDPQLRILLEAAWATIEDAGYRASSLAGTRTGFFAGVSTADYKELWQRANDPVRGAHGLSFAIANRVSYSFDLRGPSEVIDTACSSSLIAVHRAIESIRHGSCDMALAGGVNVMATPTLTIGGSQAGMLSEDGRCKTFDSRADGYGRGEGVGVVFLKPLRAAIEAGDRIYGVILASAENHGGKAASPTAPNPAAQRELLVSAYTEAGVDPRTITYIEAHGTGTELGDPIEVEALKAAFLELYAKRGLTPPAQPYCALGSVKTNIGHLEAAAGISALIKVLLMTRHRKIPGNVHLKQENAHLRMEGSPFYLVRETAEWKMSLDESGDPVPRRAGISSFGIGGSNAHIVVEEHIPGPDGRLPSEPAKSQLIVLSAKTSASLNALSRNLLQFAVSQPCTCLADLAYTLQCGREAMEERLAFVAGSMEELAARLSASLAGDNDSGRIFRGSVRDHRESIGGLASDDDMSVTIGVWMAKGKHARLLDAWVKGIDVSWEKLPRQERPVRIGLPTYPFARERYWAPNPASVAADRVTAGIGLLHPLVHRNTSQLAQQRFSSSFTGREFFLAGHVVQRQRVLPAVAYLEMARTAVEQSVDSEILGSHCIRLKNVVWVRPLIVSAGETLHVHIAIAPDADRGIRFEVYSNPSDGTGESEVHCQGLALVETARKVETLDIKALRVGLGANRVGAEECYEAFTAAGIEYGPAFRGIEEVFYNAGQVLASIRVPFDNQSPSGNGLDGFGLHPALLDSALQSSIALYRDRAAGNSPGQKVSLPFALDECEISAACTPRMFAWVRPATHAGGEGRVRKADLDLCDGDGRVCVRLRGLSARVQDAAERPPSPEGLVLYEPVWKNAVTAAGSSPAEFGRHIVFLCDGIAAAAHEIQDRLPGMQCIRSEPAGTNMAERFDHVAIELFSTIKGLVAGPSVGTVLVQVLVPSRDEQCLFSGLLGLILTARLEQPRIRTQLIEVDPAESPASLCAAILDNASRPEDSYSKYESGCRQISSWREAASLEGEAVEGEVVPPWKDGGIYLITGGAGGLGLIFAKEIAHRTSGAVLILAGRSELSSGQAAQIQEVRLAGAKVSYHRVDVSHFDAVQALVADIESAHGRLDGVIHAAGLLRDEFILRKSADSFREVLAPKVAGTLHLDRATRGIALDFFVLFSSGAGAFGSTGQSDYATANAFMDAFAVYRAGLVEKQERRGRTISIDWPLWERGTMQADEATKQRLRAMSGVVPLPTSSGIDAFYRSFVGREARVLVLEGELTRIRALFHGDGLKAADAPAARIDGEKFEAQVAAYLRQVVSAALKVPLARIELDAPMERYGIDSIVVMQLTNRLEETFGSLSKTLFFEYRTLTELSRYFVETYPAKLRDLLGADRHPAPAAAASPRAVEGLSIKRPLSAPLTQPPSIDPRATPSALDIAIIGIAGRYPESRDLDEYWENLRTGRNCITEVPPSRWDWRKYYTEDRNAWGHYSKWGGFIADVDKFDPLFFGISPREAEFLDPQERLFLEHAWMALEDAGYRRADLQKAHDIDLPGQVGVYAGVMFGEYQLLGLEAALSGRPVATASSFASVANRVSYVLNLHGPSMTVDTMCSGSLTSVHLACQDLKHGRTDLALAGGVNLTIHPNKYFLLSGGHFISSEGRCASFGVGGDGYVPGEGVGVAVLKRLTDAERDGDHIYGVIKGSSVNHGGKTNGYSVPNPSAQQMAVAGALREAGIDARRIGYVEAHGTGTALGDPIEIAGLTKAFRKHTADNRYCWIGSAKSNIGHCESAAGIAGITKVLLQMKHRELAPSIHSATLNPYIDFDATPFVVNRERRAWERPVVDGRVAPRIGAVSSFGAGGSNAHLVIEEYIGSAPSVASRPAQQGPYPIVLSARNEDRLNEYAAKLLHFFRSPLQRQTLPPSPGSAELKSAIVIAARGHLSALLGVDATQIRDEQPLEEYGVGPFDREQLLTALQREFGFPIHPHEFAGSDSIAKIAEVFRQGSGAEAEVTESRAEGAPDLAEIAWTLQVGREPMEERLGFLVESLEDLENALSAFVTGGASGSGQRTYRGQVRRHKESLAVFDRDDDMASLVASWIEKRKYDRILDLWVKGFEIDWASLYGVDRPRRTSLPAYPFARERYWIETASASEPGQKPRIPVSTASLPGTAVVACSPSWRDCAVGMASRTVEYSSHLVLLAGPAPCTAEEIEASLSGVRCVQLQFDSASPDEAYLHSAIQIVELIGYLIGKGPSERTLIQIVVPPGPEARLLSGLSGLVDSARLENPRLIGQAIELEQGETPAGLFDRISENSRNPQDSRVRYIGGGRQVACLEELAITEGSLRLPWRDHGVYLITGGAGGLGMIFAEEIAARTSHATIVIAGRSPANDEIRKRLEGKAEAGSVIEYRQLDVRQPDAVQRVIADIRSAHGGLHGVIHAAGVIRDNLIVSKTPLEFEEVLGPKVAGTVNLDRATQDLDLDFFVLFSSLSGAFGNAGQSDYAAANAFEDAYAEYRDKLVASGRRRGQTLSINWPLWQAGGMHADDAVVAMMTRVTGMIPMKSASGLRAFYLGLSSGRSRLMFMEGEKTKIRAAFLLGSPASPAASAISTPPDDAVLRDNVRQQLKRLLGEAFKLAPEAVDAATPVESYGVESVAIGQMTQRLETTFGELPKTLFYEFPTLEALAAHLLAEYPAGCRAWGRPAGTPHVTPEPVVASVVSAAVHVIRPIADSEPIAIIGVAGRFPASGSLDEYWENLRTGKACFIDVPAERWSLSEFYEPDPDKATARARSYCKTGGFLTRFGDFDPLFFNIAPVEAYRLDPHERLLLTTCWEAMENSGHSKKSLQDLYEGSVGVFVGVTKLGFHLHTQLGGTLETSRLPSTSFSSMANRISYQLNLTGPSMAIDTMCSSSVTAIHEACEHIRRGDCRVAFAASANLYLHPRSYIDLCLGKLVTAQPEPLCFSSAGTGFVPGEAAGAVLLKPLTEAIRDGDPIHGVIRSSAINHGGKTTGYTAPSLSKQAEVVNLALERAGCDPDSIDFVESAANGSALGDAIELRALQQAFKSRAGEPCLIGTLKASVGHSEAASGISQLMKVLLQMKHQQLAPTRSAGGSDWGESLFELVEEARPWPRRTTPRRALITSFGAGGSYGAIVVEDHTTSADVSEPGTAPAASTGGKYLFVISARTEQQLRASASNLLVFVRSTQVSLPSIAFTLQRGRDAFEYGLAIVASDRAALIGQLEAFVEGCECTGKVAACFVGRRTSPSSDAGRESVRHAVIQRDLTALAQLWLAGYDDIPWSSLYDSPVPRSVLPGYPFSERTFWYDQRHPAPPVEGASINPARENAISRRNGQPSVPEIEEELSSLIRKILLMSEDDPLDIHANFAEIGLDSLNGTHFVRKLAEARGVELRETIVFDYPSVSALAAYMSGLNTKTQMSGDAAASDVENVISDDFKPDDFKRRLGSLMRQYAEIVPLQMDGNGPVVFCLHPMSGDVGLYAKLAEASKLRFRMIGIKSRGLLSEAEPLETIQAMAAHAVILATAILPEGPIHLLGSSMGGTVAYESARQLQLAGRSVETLFLIESPLVENESDALLWTSGSLDNWIMNANFLMIGTLHMDPDFRRRKEAGQVKWSQLEITRNDVQALEERGLEEQGVEERDLTSHLAAVIGSRGATMSTESLAVRLRSMAAVHLANLRGLSGYRAEPLLFPDAIHAVLVRTQSGAAVSPDVYNPDYLVAVQRAKGSLLPFFEGWRRVLPRMAVEVVEGGNHFDLLSAHSALHHVSDVISRSLKVEFRPATAPLPPHTRKVAVVGMSGRFPGAPTTEAFWDLLKRGRSAFTDLPSDREWRMTEQVYVKHGGFLPDIDWFDPVFFGIPPREAESIDPAERIFLEETWKAIEDAGVDPAALAGRPWGVFCGGGGDFTLHLKELTGVSPHVTASSLPGRVSYTLNLTGPCVAVDAGCASSMLAIAQAADALMLGQCDVAIAGGVWVFSTPNLLRAGCESRLFSQEDVGYCLSSNASGIMAGEAAGALILKPLEEAMADADRIYGVIEAWGSGHNGHTNGMAAPGVAGQVALYSSVYNRFGIDPSTIGLLEANAVGTPLGDKIEVEALTQAFRATTDRNGYCALGSVENNVGHAFQGSGIAHVIKVLLALEHKEIPATVKAGLQTGMDLGRTPFLINNHPLPWLVGKGQVRRAATSSFGTTGINVHMVICEAPPPSYCTSWEDAAPRFHLIALSGKTEAAVAARARELLAHLNQQPDADAGLIGRISANLILRRSHFNERRALVVADLDELVIKLTILIRGEDAEDVFAGSVSRAQSERASRAIAAALTRAAASQRRTDRGTLLALAELYVLGVPLDLSPCFSDAEKTPVSLPSYPFERRRYWPSELGKMEPEAIRYDIPREAPKTDALSEIQSIVAEVSGYATSELPADAPLTRLGLDSLMTMRVLALVNERFSRELHLADLAESGTIQSLSSLVGRDAIARRTEADAQVVKPGLGGDLPRAAWLFRRFAPVPRGLYVKSFQTAAASATSLKLVKPMERLLRAGVAVCHDGVECHLVAHQSVDAMAVYESLSPPEKRELIASLPPGVLVGPISQEQERNLYHSESMNRSSWNLQQTFELGAPLDKKLLNSAMSRLMENQDLLRTHYLRLGESWAQVVLPEAPVAIEDVGVTTVQALQRLLETERAKLLDVYYLPVFRVWIAQADGAQYLAFVTHHSLADAFTPRMLLSELMNFYNALAECRFVPEPRIDEQYWQFALRQFDSSVYRGPRTLEYWRERLSGRSTSMRLPYSRSFDRIDPELLEAADAVAVLLPGVIVKQVDSFGREHDVTHTQLFTAAIAMVLVHGLGNAAALLRFVNSQRSSASLMNTPGEFTGVSFLALDIDRGATLLNTLREVKKRSLESLKFSRVDFRELLRLSDLSDYNGYYRQIGDVTIDSVDFDTANAVQQADEREESHGRLRYGETGTDAGTSAELLSTGTLMFQLIRLGGEIRLLTFFRKHLFEKAVIQDLCDLVVSFVQAIVTDPGQHVSDLPAKQSIPDNSQSVYFTECQRVNSVEHGRPVFWIHGAFGDASVYIPLARAIDRPFYGIQARGLFDDQAPLSGVAEIASFYVSMIRAIQPEGPYDLGGYSIGGIFAYEVGRRLLAEGSEVRSLCLVDTLFHPYYETLLHCSGGLAETYEFVSLGLVEMSGSRPEAIARVRESFENAEGVPETTLLSAYVDACRADGVAKPRVWIESFIGRMVRLLRGYRIDEYGPQPLQGQIEHVLYFQRRGGWVFSSGSGMNGQPRGGVASVDYWSEWSTLLPNIQYREIVAENHMTILREADALRVIGGTCRDVYRAERSKISNATRETVGAIVSQILDVDLSALDPARPLSSYGIDSFGMTQILQRLRSAFDLDLDMDTMSTLDTFGKIVRHIEQTVRAPRPSAEARARQFPELIRLNRMTQGRPVFWIHGGLGGVELYRHLAEVSERPFFGIQARGWMTDRAPLSGIHAMAAYYVHVMQSVQRTGPYDVGGYSLGGLIAYEVVRQLQELGESVSTLVMVDTFDTSAFRDASMSDRADLLAWPILNFALQSRGAAPGADVSRLLISREELDADLTAEAKLTQLIALAKARGLREPENRLRAMVRRLTEVHRAYEADRYRIRPLSNPEDVDCRYFRNKRGLFLGALEPYYVPSGPVSWDRASYWTEWMEHLPNFRMTDVDASNHMVMLTEPESRDVIVNACRELYSRHDGGSVSASRAAAVEPA